VNHSCLCLETDDYTIWNNISPLITRSQCSLAEATHTKHHSLIDYRTQPSDLPCPSAELEAHSPGVALTALLCLKNETPSSAW